jgi:nitrogen PTS system EIIA component
VLHLTQPMVALGFLETPTEYGAIDGEPVHIFFTLLSPTARAHLHLLARLSYFLRDRRLRRALEEEAGREKVMRVVRELEAELPALKVEARRIVEVGR